MNLRITFYLVLLALLTGNSFTASAQNTYLKFGSAYNYGLGSSISAYSQNGTVHKDYTATITVTQEKINFGQGWQFNIAGGHFFTENIGAELSLGLLPGKTHKTESRFYHSYNGVTEGLNQTHSARFLLVQPSVIMRMSPKTITPYGRLGFSLAKGSIKYTEKYTVWTDSNEKESEITGGLGFGFLGGAGLDFAANNQITFYTELTFSSLSWSPKKWELTKSTENNKTVIDQVPPGDRETLYTDEFTLQYDKNGDLISTSGPGNDLKTILPMNTLGLAFGMKLTF